MPEFLETLSADDIDWLTRTEERFIRLRKREQANTNSSWVVGNLTRIIDEIEETRMALKGRLQG